MEKWDRLSKIMPTVLGTMLGANILTMSIMNFFEYSTRLIPVVYFSSLLVMIFLMGKCRLQYPTLTKREHQFCLSLALILFLPRVPYFFESALGYALYPVGDDYFHIPDLASLIHSNQFPPRSTYDSTEYLGYYYAAWIPGAALYHTGLLTTVKQALALLKLVYALLIVYFPVYASKVLFTDRRWQITFVILCCLYGGFDFLYWLSSLKFVPVHSEWWAADFGFSLQFSNFITLSLWTPQHFLAGLAVLFGLYVVHTSDRMLAHALSGLFFLSGFFSSPYTVLGATPLVIWYLFSFGKLRTLLAAAPVFIVVSLPLWWVLIGIEKLEFQWFGALGDEWQNSKRAAFLVFLLIILLELWPLILAAGYFVIRTRRLASLCALSMAYLLSTFFIYYHANYSMRGAIVPIFTLTYLATPILYAVYQEKPRRWLRVVAILYLLGGVLEYTSFTRSAVLGFRESRTAFNERALQSNQGSQKWVSMELTREASQDETRWHLLEKLKPVRKSPLTDDEAHLMHPDNRYRLTFSKLFGTAPRAYPDASR